MKERTYVAVHWLGTQAFCEYQLSLEYKQDVKIKPTKAMTIGKKEHERLYLEFRRGARMATFDEMIEQSKRYRITSRELSVFSERYRLIGKIDEIRLSPRGIIIIDDKSETNAYLGDKRQVYGYCLGFKERLSRPDPRPIIAALRQRGTDTIYWKSSFNNTKEAEIITIIERIHALMAGKIPFKPTTNKNKCRACKLKQDCDIYNKEKSIGFQYNIDGKEDK